MGDNYRGQSLTPLLPSAGGEPVAIGQVSKASGEVTISRAGKDFPAQVGAALYDTDKIRTGAQGAVGITFNDKTKFSTGPNSEIALSEFQFDSRNIRDPMLNDMRAGTPAPGAIKIKVPTAVLGVRGHLYHLSVQLKSSERFGLPRANSNCQRKIQMSRDAQIQTSLSVGWWVGNS
jgi:hypothetical protein